MNDETDLLENISDLEAGGKLLIMSYKFGLDFFEAQIFSRLKGKSVKPLLFIDYKEYQDIFSLNTLSNFAEKSYFISNIRTKAVFHPKVLLYITESQITLEIGSNNLNKAGYLENLESVIDLKFNKDQLENAYFLHDLIDILNDVTPFITSKHHSEKLDAIITEIKDFISVSSQKNASVPRNSHLISNAKKSILSQVKYIIKDDITSIVIMCPSFANTRQFFQDLLNIGKKITIIVQNEKNNLPKKELVALKGITYQEFIPTETRGLHAKMMLFQTRTSAFLLTGSANCSRPALELSTNNGGNFEICILSKIKPIVFKELIEKEGKIRLINLNDIRVDPNQIPPKKNEIPSLFLKEAFVKGDEIYIGLDSQLKMETAILIINGIEKTYRMKKEGTYIKFQVPEEDWKDYKNTVVVQIKIENQISDFMLLHYPKTFDDKFSSLDRNIIDDPDWFFSLLRELSRTDNLRRYLNLLFDFIDLNSLDSDPEKENILKKFNKRLMSQGHFTNDFDIKEFLKRLFNEHERRVSKLQKFGQKQKTDQDVTSGAKRVLRSFVVTNKVILWCIKNYEDKLAEEFSFIRIIMDSLRNKIIPFLQEFRLVHLLSDFMIFYHCKFQSILSNLIIRSIPLYQTSAYEHVKVSLLNAMNICQEKVLDVTHEQILEIKINKIAIEYGDVDPERIEIMVNIFHKIE